MNKSAYGMAALVFAGVVAASALPVDNAQAAEPTVKCHLKYNLAGWSLFYKRAEGSGTVSCDNGQHAAVRIQVVGGGLTAGKYRIDDGRGEISTVHGISEVFGDYAQAGADAGVVKSSQAQVLTKGTTSLALAGTGQGVNLGVSFGKFSIIRR